MNRLFDKQQHSWRSNIEISNQYINHYKPSFLIEDNNNTKKQSILFWNYIDLFWDDCYIKINNIIKLNLSDNNKDVSIINGVNNLNINDISSISTGYIIPITSSMLEYLQSIKHNSFYNDNNTTYVLIGLISCYNHSCNSNNSITHRDKTIGSIYSDIKVPIPSYKKKKIYHL